ncbi:13642_t:CDS:2 [Racocetra persica]|uniref:13642_t:CDS:1 n=1 Tax=Racocetra persica TaxID=160502 RepID=A0ACA9PTI5_9GLOM|nr:13642_t:CDS:2 [Racocetra persica]
MNKSQFDNKNFQDENSYDENSQDKNFQDENSQDESSQCDNSQHENSQDFIQKKSAKHCPNQNKEVKDFYNQVIANRQGSSQAVSQNLVLESTKLTSQYEHNIDLALIKAFIVCNILFHVISNLYFIDTLRELRSGYQPPSRQLLAG